MDMHEMEKALDAVTQAYEFLLQAGEEGLAEHCFELVEKCLARYEAEGGDVTMYEGFAEA